ncbi:NAD(P)-binding protein [Ochrobactrum ciceri]|uniref:NAD(P)-binding protein n=1 Tax=Brucella ciceri TaxID=391287 RepID=A0ABX1DSE4_9HYPH|nr:NAD(P)-binding protein [Brucella ciceri]
MIGGGTAGSAAAFTLAKAGLHVLVVDRPPSRSLYRIGESLPGQAIHLLKRKGLFEWVQHSHPLENPGDLSAWDPGNSFRMIFFSVHTGTAGISTGLHSTNACNKPLRPPVQLFLRSHPAHQPSGPRTVVRSTCPGDVSYSMADRCQRTP